jgi:hypothetical protein
VGIGSPFDVLELPDKDRLKPSAGLHFLGGQPFAPPTALCFGEIAKRELLHLQAVEALEQLVT